VLDFGISKLSADDQPSMHLTRTGAVIGTPYYMSPEQIRGTGEIDRRVDIYAFGVILYESLAGQVPFTAETYGALVLEIATGTPTPLHELVPNLPAELSRIVLRAMARDVAARYPTMEDLLAALESFARPAMSNSSGALWRSSQRFHSASGEHLPLDETLALPTPLPSSSGSGLPAYLSTPAPAGDARPSRATTPFAAEANRSRASASRHVFGIAGIVAAAALVVGTTWYLTRDPQPAHVIGPPVVAPQLGNSRSATSAELPPAPADEIPRGVSPNSAPLPTDETGNAGTPSDRANVGANPMTITTVGAVNAPPQLNQVDQVELAPVTPLRPNRAESRRGRSSSWHGRKPADGSKDNDPSRTPKVGDAPEPAEQQNPKDTQRQTPQQRARSGTLNVNEF
jgi:serine/threonine-protein kinase